MLEKSSKLKVGQYEEKVFIECSGSRDKIEKTFKSEELGHLGTDSACLRF